MTTQPSPPIRDIGRKQFSVQDQEAFASWSADRNPMHVDGVAARRLLTGQPVVHGVHVLITALEFWDRADGMFPVSLDCTFNNAVNVGDPVVFVQKSTGVGQVALEASVHGMVCTKIRITVAPADEVHVARVARLDAAAVPDASGIDRLGVPLDELAAHWLNKQVVLRIGAQDLSRHFPRSCHLLGNSRVAGLLALSYFVGMVCPGLNSIFSTISLKLAEGSTDAGSIQFNVQQYDERFRLYTVTLDGVLRGRLTAFVRPPPQRQPSMTEVCEQVGPADFAGTRSLVIGASRGLGELCAKLLAAGGGDVVISYAQGLDDIERVNAEINAGGVGRTRILHLDILSGAYTGIDFETLDAIYYFATPRIYRKKSEVFVDSLFREFIHCYVTSLYALCRHVESLPLPKKIKVYVPSSVFIAERPDGMTEYAMAKAAAEVLIEDLNRSLKKVFILATRLPKLTTDQTSSVLRASTGDNLSALLPVVRAMAA